MTREQAAAVAAELRLDDPEFRERTEYDVYRLFREHLPAAKLTHEPAQPVVYTRYEDCKYILQHPQTFSSHTIDDLPVVFIPQQLDPPEQRAYRRILEPVFSPQEMSELEPDIEKFAHELIDGLVAKGEFEFMEEFAVPFPTIIFCQLMGFPVEDHAKLMRWEGLLLHGTSTTVAEREGYFAGGHIDLEKAEQKRQQAAMEVVGYIRGLLDARRQAPRDDLMSKLLSARLEDGRTLTQEELDNICFLFFLAGLDTVTGALGLIVETLAKRPDTRHELIRVMDDPQQMALAIEELMRYHSTVNVPRRATSQCPVAGYTIGKGEQVLAALVGANRDERVFANPDEIQLDRHPNPHLAFAVGVHRCLGIHLARRELRIGLRALLQRVPDFSIQPGQEPRLYTGGLRGLSSLPLRIGS